MRSATFFGHRKFDYLPYKDNLRKVLVDVIENYGVKKFYNGFRGNFDVICAEAVFELKTIYPDIKNIIVLSYLNIKNLVLPKYFDESVYLLEKRVLPQYAISHTNREMVLRSDFVISGVFYHYGGAYTACDFVRRNKKIIFDIFA